MGSARKSLSRSFSIAITGFTGQVVCRIAQKGGICSDGITQVNHHGQLFVVDDHGFGCVARLLQRERNNGDHCLTHKAHAFMGQRATCRRRAGLTVQALKGRPGNGFDACGHHVSAGNDLQHARHGTGFFDVYRNDARVCIRRAQKENTGMPVCVHIAGELAGANQQRIVFQAANRLTAAKTGGLQAGVGGGHEG